MKNLIKKILREEIEDDGFDWIRDIPIELIPGETYFIKTHNDMYWEPRKLYNIEFDGEFNGLSYKFGDVGSEKPSGGMSYKYVSELIKSGKIREYDPNWRITDEIKFSDDINSVDDGNFSIMFSPPVSLDQTKNLQKILHKKGYKFHTKKKNQIITNNDSDRKIEFFECFNWDTSKPRYKSMDPKMRDNKSMLLVSVRSDSDWLPNNSFFAEQQKYSAIVDHNAVVINGNKYLNK